MESGVESYDPVKLTPLCTPPPPPPPTHTHTYWHIPSNLLLTDPKRYIHCDIFLVKCSVVFHLQLVYSFNNYVT